jgi:hypothetical protein
MAVIALESGKGDGARHHQRLCPSGQFRAARQGAGRQSLRRSHPAGYHPGYPKNATAREIERAHVDEDYRGHDTEIRTASGQKRGVFGAIKRELRRRSAIEPVIGNLKTEGCIGRCYLKCRIGDAANAILSAVGYNFRQIPHRREFLRVHCRSPSIRNQ